MTRFTISLRAATSFGLVIAALSGPTAGSAQVTTPMNADEIGTLPPEYRAGPVVEDVTETVMDENGVETITRTRRIERPASVPETGASYAQYPQQRYVQNPAYEPYYAQAYAPAPAVFEREQWIAECERRTIGRDEDEKGGIIGGLLGAIAGGIIGNRVADGERLAGTLIGAGTGGLAGLLIGGLFGGGRDEDGDYDCEAALDSYLSQYGYGGPAIAARTIPARYPAYVPQPQIQPQVRGTYGYGYTPGYQYSYAPPQQIVYVPIRYEQQQRVIVRETVREETVPGSAREIPAPAPRPVPAPPRYIKGN